MNKEFVPYEQALALKELGFDEPCFGYYGRNKKITMPKECINKAPKAFKTFCLTPTYSAAFRWFREKHDLEHEILYDLGNDLTNKVYLYSIYVTDNRSEEYKTYEEAESACLDKLIEIVKHEDTTR